MSIHNMFCNDINFLQKVVIFHPTNTNKFLALQRSADNDARPNDWDLVGGHVEFGEDTEESIKREANEEAGISLHDIKPIQVVTTYPTEKVCKLVIGYTGHTTTEKVHLSHEHSSYMWVTAKEFNKLTKTQFLLDLVALSTKHS